MASHTLKKRMSPPHEVFRHHPAMHCSHCHPLLCFILFNTGDHNSASAIWSTMVLNSIQPLWRLVVILQWEAWQQNETRTKDKLKKPTFQSHTASLSQNSMPYARLWRYTHAVPTNTGSTGSQNGSSSSGIECRSSISPSTQRWYNSCWEK